MSGIHLDEQMCRQCRGLCCQGHAGVWVDPQRFLRLFMQGETFERGALPEGITLRDLGGVEVPSPQTLHDGCVFLEASGCKLPEQSRPCQCLALQPVIETLMEGEMHCTLAPAYSSKSARDNWRRFWNEQKGKTL